MTETLQRKSLRDLVNEVVKLTKERPDVIYEGVNDPGESAQCSNIRGDCSDGTKGCIVGQAFFNLGFLPEDLEFKEDDDTIKDYNDSSVNEIGEAFFDMSYAGAEEDLRWLAIVQDNQDGGDTWGEAAEKANLDRVTPHRSPQDLQDQEADDDIDT
jgi:hypothetical protein